MTHPDIIALYNTHGDLLCVLKLSRHLESDDLERQFKQGMVVRIIISEKRHPLARTEQDGLLLERDHNGRWLADRRQDTHQRVGVPKHRRRFMLAKQTGRFPCKARSEHGHLDPAICGSLRRHQSLQHRALDSCVAMHGLGLRRRRLLLLLAMIRREHGRRKETLQICILLVRRRQQRCGWMRLRQQRGRGRGYGYRRGCAVTT